MKGYMKCLNNINRVVKEKIKYEANARDEIRKIYEVNKTRMKKYCKKLTQQ